MAVTDLANDAAVTGAGYAKAQVDRGTTNPNNPKDVNTAQNPQFLTRYQKHVVGAAGGRGDSWEELVAEGESTVSAAAADTAAVANLNAIRRHRYGGSPGRASGGVESVSPRGGTHTADTT
jgi:hypothetical protein